MANAGFWTGMSRATEHAGAVGMNVLEYKGRQEDRAAALGIARDRLAIEQEQNKRAETAFQFEEQKRQKIEAENKAIVPASLVNPRIHEYPTQKAKLVEAAQSAGYNIREEGGELYGPKEAFAYMGGLVKAGNAESAEYIKAGRVDLQTKAQGLIQQIGELKQSEKTDEKTVAKIQGLEKNLMGVKAQIAQTFDIEDKVMEQSRINANKPDNKDHLMVVGHQVLDVSDPKNPKVVHTAPYAPSGGGGEGSTAKEAKTKISEVNAYIRKTSANRAKWLKEYEKDPNSDYGKKMAAEIENFDNQLSIAEDTLAGLQDGSIDPKTVKSGGGASTKAQKLDEKTAASILQEAGGDKEKARAIAKQRGFTF